MEKQMLRNGQQYLSDMIAEYPVKKTADGIQPILYINSRIKAPESLTLKLQKKGLQEDCDTALEKIHDLIGIRVICSFGEEVYQVAEWISNREHVEVIERKDYIAYPKPNGYRSLSFDCKVYRKRNGTDYRRDTASDNCP
ncbi:MAG: GTP pyrophosphokinase family protein [Coprococcus phoceensis]